MREELRLVNAVIGMTADMPGWPNVLHLQGFKLAALQRTVKVAGLPGALKPEAIFFSATRNEAVVIESKSQSLSEPQAHKYWNLTMEDLIEADCLPGSASSGGISPVYFCEEEAGGHLGPAIEHFNDQYDANLPLVVYNNKQFRLRTGDIRNRGLHTAFSSTLWFDERYWPTRFVPYDAESSPEELLPGLLQELRALLWAAEVDLISAEQLAGGHPSIASDGCVPSFTALHGLPRKQLIGMIRVLVEELRYHCLKNYLGRQKAGSWKRKSTLSTRALQRVGPCLRSYLEHKREGTPFGPVPLMDTAAIELAGE